MVENVVIIASMLAILALVFFTQKKTKSEKEHERKMEESMDDEFIYDPDTGAKLTLEQAESGNWSKDDVEFRIVPEIEIEKYYEEEEQESIRAFNYLKEQIQYKEDELGQEQIKLLKQTETLRKYDSWNCFDVFRLEYCKGFIFSPKVKFSAYTRHADGYEEPQCMFWLILGVNLGHYYLREKATVEKILDLIKDDDDLKLANYESFTFKKTENILYLGKVLESFEGQKGLEIEFMGENLFIKNLKYINLEDILRIEEIVRKISNVK